MLDFNFPIKKPVNMFEYEKRMVEIYSYYLEERYFDDLSQTFIEWLNETVHYKNVVEKWFAQALEYYMSEGK
jgi:hypothetical protein